MGGGDYKDKIDHRRVNMKFKWILYKIQVAGNFRVINFITVTVVKHSGNNRLGYY